MRPSGRAPDQMRELRFEPGFTRHAEGSCLVSFGDTRVLVTAIGRGQGPAVPARQGPGLGHRRIWHAAARHPHPRQPRGGQGQAIGPDAGNPAADRPLAARGGRPDRSSASARSSSIATSSRPTAAPAPRRFRAPGSRCASRSTNCSPTRALAADPIRDAGRRGQLRHPRRHAGARPRLCRGQPGRLRRQFRADRRRRDRRGAGHRRGRMLSTRKACCACCASPASAAREIFAAQLKAVGTMRPIGDKLVIATHNPGKLREIAALLEPLGIACVGAAELDLPEPEEIGNTFVDNADLKAREAADLSGPSGARRRQRPVRRCARRPARASSPRAGPRTSDGNRDFGAGDGARLARASRPPGPTPAATPISPARWRSPGPTTARPKLRRPGRRHAGLAAARRPGLRLRPDVRARRPRADLRRDGPGGKARASATAPTPSASWWRRCIDAHLDAHAAATECWTMAARALHPLAVLRQQMPLLRLQQPCPRRRSTRTRGATRCSPTSRTRRALLPGAPADLDLLRRRHAVADGAGDGRGADRRPRASIGRPPTTSRSRSRPIPTRSRRRASPISPRPASTGSRSACRASTTTRSPSSAAPIRRREGLAALDIAQRHFARVSFDLIYALPGDDRGALGARRSTARWRSAPAICRSTS